VDRRGDDRRRGLGGKAVVNVAASLVADVAAAALGQLLGHQMGLHL